MKRHLMIPLGILLIATAVFADSLRGRDATKQSDPAACPFPDESVPGQSQGKQKQTVPRHSEMMMCPMMEMMQSMKGGQGVKQPMGTMFAFSADEIASALADKKAALGLTDAQAKQIAELVANLQQQKWETMKEHMMDKMQGGKMNCPCMRVSPK